MGETLDARIAFLQRQLHAISLSIEQAKGRNDTAAVAALVPLYNKVAADIEQLKQDAYDQEAPSQFMQTLAGLSDEVIKTAKQFRDAGVSVVAGAGTVIKWLPVVLVVALIVVGLVYAGKIRKDLK